MYSRAIRTNNAVLSYDVQGQGSHVLLMFHGAGQDRSVFRQLPAGILASFRIYAFDLFFHGESTWSTNDPISKEAWKLLIEAFCSSEQVDTFSVLGYSIGARFALATLEAFPQKVNTCYLVAPDGLARSAWFDLATGSAIGRRIFKRLMSNPRGMHRMFGMANRTRLMDPATLRFLEHQLDNEQKRARIYQTWINFRLLRFSQSSLARLVQASQINFVVFVANRDRIIPIKHLRAFLKRLKSAHLEIIDANHRRVLSEALARIVAP